MVSVTFDWYFLVLRSCGRKKYICRSFGESGERNTGVNRMGCGNAGYGTMELVGSAPPTQLEDKDFGKETRR